MHSRATDRRSASKCQGKWPVQTLEQAFGLPEVLVAVSTSRLSCKRGGTTRTFDAGLGFIWRISNWMVIPAQPRGITFSIAPRARSCEGPFGSIATEWLGAIGEAKEQGSADVTG